MISRRTALVAIAPALLLGSLVACSSKSGGTGGDDTTGTGGTTSSGSTSTSASSGAGTGASCQAYQVPTGTDLTTPTVSFKNDVVINVFNTSCGAAACHGSTAGAGVVQLGTEAAAGSDAAQVRTGLVGVASLELSTMPYVTAGKPEESYLMHKMDGDQCQFTAQCVGGSCLATMPNGGTALPVTERDVVRRWIAQGALDN